MLRTGMALLALAGLATAAVTMASPSVDPLDAPRQQLVAARQHAAAARARADRLDMAASGERDTARRATIEETAVAARVDAAQADIAAAQARMAIIGALLDSQRARLATQQAPEARLLGALQSLARRPTIVALVQPGSIDDLIHLRAVLGAVQPAIAARTVAVRGELDRARRLRGDAALAATASLDGRARLEGLRLQLGQVRAAQRFGAGDGDRLAESDRAIALGERARDIAATMAQAADATDIRAALQAVEPPLPRPDRAGDGGAAIAWSPAHPPYRLPVAGRLVTGLGELSDAGVRSRGLTFAVAADAPVVAPAAGRIVFAGPFRDYRLVVIIDHGRGWTTLLSGLGRVTVALGAHVAQGSAIGRAAPGDPPRVTVELRRRDRAMDITALAG